MVTKKKEPERLIVTKTKDAERLMRVRVGTWRKLVARMERAELALANLRAALRELLVDSSPSAQTHVVPLAGKRTASQQERLGPWPQEEADLVFEERRDGCWNLVRNRYGVALEGLDAKECRRIEQELRAFLTVAPTVRRIPVDPADRATLPWYEGEKVDRVPMRPGRAIDEPAGTDAADVVFKQRQDGLWDVVKNRHASGRVADLNDAGRDRVLQAFEAATGRAPRVTSIPFGVTLRTSVMKKSADASFDRGFLDACVKVREPARRLAKKPRGPARSR